MSKFKKIDLALEIRDEMSIQLNQSITRLYKKKRSHSGDKPRDMESNISRKQPNAMQVFQGFRNHDETFRTENMVHVHLWHIAIVDNKNIMIILLQIFALLN